MYTTKHHTVTLLAFVLTKHPLTTPSVVHYGGVHTGRLEESACSIFLLKSLGLEFTCFAAFYFDVPCFVFL